MVMVAILSAGCVSLPESLPREAPLIQMKVRADEGDIHSKAILASVYRKGELGVKKDFETALKYLSPAVKAKDALAIFELGQMCEYGETAKRDKEKAESLYTVALPGLKRLAEEGDARSQYAMGILYENGIGGVARNQALAARWFLRAARRGYGGAQFRAGLYYEKGTGVERDQRKALFYYNNAAGQGNALALYSLGQIHLDGTGVGGVDVRRALVYFLRAEQAGLPSAELQARTQLMLGMLYVSARNDKEAAEWLFRVQKSGDPTATALMKDFLSDSNVQISMKVNNPNLQSYLSSLEKGQPLAVPSADSGVK